MNIAASTEQVCFLILSSIIILGSLGVVLLNITDAKNEQYSFYEVEDYDKSDTVMGTIDSVNEKFGNRSIFFGAQGINKDWKMRADRKSAMYTTKVDDLPRVI